MNTTQILNAFESQAIALGMDKKPEPQALTLQQFIDQKDQLEALGFTQVEGSLHLGMSFWIYFDTTPKQIEHLGKKNYLTVKHEGYEGYLQTLVYEVEQVFYDPSSNEYIFKNLDGLNLKLEFVKPETI